jgi:hypothetical protein
MECRSTDLAKSRPSQMIVYTTVYSSLLSFLLRDIWITQVHGIGLCCVDRCPYVLSSTCWKGISTGTSKTHNSSFTVIQFIFSLLYCVTTLWDSVLREIMNNWSVFSLWHGKVIVLRTRSVVTGWWYVVVAVWVTKNQMDAGKLTNDKDRFS